MAPVAAPPSERPFAHARQPEEDTGSVSDKLCSRSLYQSYVRAARAPFSQSRKVSNRATTESEVTFGFHIRSCDFANAGGPSVHPRVGLKVRCRDPGAATPGFCFSDNFSDRGGQEKSGRILSPSPTSEGDGARTRNHRIDSPVL